MAQRRSRKSGASAWWTAAILVGSGAAAWWWFATRRIEAPAPVAVPGAGIVQSPSGEEITRQDKAELERVLRERSGGGGATRE
jgi:hypothetical protein